MSIRIGHALGAENGTHNGKPGDSTGKEVAITKWYNKSWDYIAIYPDDAVREKHAQAVENICNNDYIGYGQNDRNTAYLAAKKVNFDINKIKTKCNIDCSALQNLAAVVANTPNVTYGHNGWTTATMKDNLIKAGYKIITDKKYLTSESYCVRGAIYVRAGYHTFCALDNGSDYKKTLSYAKISTPVLSDKIHIGIATAKKTMNVREHANVSGKICGTVTKGQSVKVIEVLSNNWYKIIWDKSPCGYAYTSNSDGSYYNYKIDGYKVKVTADGLNIRSGPGTKYNIVGCIRNKGEYIIIDTIDGWGKLSNNIGWISLKYTQNLGPV